ncbi:nucleotidyltransferase domain-containing protein [Streptomyces sp. NRRL S-87]|uniref:nucleotidyltransferase domain-containing protein n=1 Tax=Streptomyces sp. NRRL S-87 TaxID=1463920 RepID=UPI001F26D669|nr:nucleotidyltransferase domain-containing protein [Streptomyces sp. NRRL S-87]
MGRVEHRGLDGQGFIEREGSFARIGAEFQGLVADARDRIVKTYGRRLHSAYLYGSLPRGTARPGRSDLDLLLALHGEPTAADREAAADLAADLDSAHPVVDGVGLLLFGKERLLSEAERYDLGWFVACLCTPLLGADLAEHLPRYRPDALLARETNGDLADLLPKLRQRIAEAERAGAGTVAVAGVTGSGAGGPGDAAYRRLVRGWSRQLVRTAFTLVMPRWGGWTSDLGRQAEAFAEYYPERAGQLREAARLALEPTADPAVLHAYAEDLGPWLAAEYAAVIGVKSPRPAG